MQRIPKVMLSCRPLRHTRAHPKDLENSLSNSQATQGAISGGNSLSPDELLRAHLLEAHAIDLRVGGSSQKEAGEVAAHKLPIWAAGHIQDVAVCVIGRLRTHTIHERLACSTPIQLAITFSCSDLYLHRLSNVPKPSHVYSTT